LETEEEAPMSNVKGTHGEAAPQGGRSPEK
jgi:hypothetical protein